MCVGGILELMKNIILEKNDFSSNFFFKLGCQIVCIRFYFDDQKYRNNSVNTEKSFFSQFMSHKL